MAREHGGLRFRARWARALAGCAVLAAAGPARADLIPPGHRPIVHELVLESAAPIAGWQLVAAPFPGLVGVTLVQIGAPFEFSSKYGTRLYAVPVGEELPARFEASWAEGRPSADFGVSEVRTVPLVSLLGSVRTTLRLVEVTPAALRLEFAGEQRFSVTGAPFSKSAALWMLPLPVLGVAGLALLRRRRTGARERGRA